MPAGDTQDRYGNLIRSMRATVALLAEKHSEAHHAAPILGETLDVLAALLNGALAELTSQQTRLARQGELLNQSGQRESRLLKRVDMLSTALDAARKETTSLMRQLKACESTQGAWEKDLGS